MTYLTEKGNWQVRYTCNANLVIRDAMQAGLQRTIRTSDVLRSLMRFDCAARSVLMNRGLTEGVLADFLGLHRYEKTEYEGFADFLKRTLRHVRRLQHCELTTLHCLLAVADSPDHEIREFLEGRGISPASIRRDAEAQLRAPIVPFFEAATEFREDPTIVGMVLQAEELRKASFSGRERMKHNELKKLNRLRDELFGLINNRLVQLWQSGTKRGRGVPE